MINMFQHYLRSAYVDKDDATTQLRRAHLPLKPLDFPTRHPGSIELVETKPLVRREGRAGAPKAPYGGSACSSKLVR